MSQQAQTRPNGGWQPTPGSSSSSTSILRGVNNSVTRSEVICRESETIAKETLEELAHQRESLGRTRDRILDANTELNSTNKNLKYMHLRIVTNKLLLCSIILMEVIIIGLQLYLKFRK